MTGRLLFIGIVAVAFYAYTHPPQTKAASATVTQGCSAAVPGAATVTLAWPAAKAGAQQTWFDISLAPGFAPGWFQGRGPLAPTQTAYVWDGVPAGLTFYYRINTLYTDGWRETATGSFVSKCGDSGGSGPAIPGEVRQSCENGSVTAKFTWQAGAGGDQWLDLSTQNNGFAPGTFVGVGPVPAGTTHFIWGGIALGATHYWRVNTLTANGWQTSSTGSFTSSTCRPPMLACIGFLSGLSGSGRGECEQLAAKGDAVGKCIGFLIGQGGDPGLCVTAVYPPGTGDTYLNDCLLGLSGQSHFGRTSCRIYYERG